MSWKIVLVLAFVALLLTGCVQPVADTNSIKTPTPVKITLIAKPFQVTAGDPYTISWRLEGGGQGKITHTAVHWDLNSRPEEYRAYAYTSEIFQGNTPDTFIASLTAPESGTIFARAHAIVDGENVYSEEFQIKVRTELFVNPIKPAEQPVSTPQSYSIAADDGTLNPSSLTANVGQATTLNFTFNDASIYYGGLDVRSELFPTVQYRKGTSNTESVTFTPTTAGTFTFKTYWPASGVLKRTGTIVVSQ